MIDIVITANNLDAPLYSVPEKVDLYDGNANNIVEKITRKTRRGILEAILRFHKRVRHEGMRFRFWVFRDFSICSAYRATLRDYIAVGPTGGILGSYNHREDLDLKLRAPGQGYFYWIKPSNVIIPTPYHIKLTFSPLALQHFSNCNHATLQYLDRYGLWSFFPVIVTARKTRAIKNSRPPVFGEVITTTQQEEVVTLLLALEDLYDQITQRIVWHFDSLQECLQSPVVYLSIGDTLYWKRLALTTTDHVLHTDKQRAYITLEGVIVREILDL